MTGAGSFKRVLGGAARKGMVVINPNYDLRAR